MYLPEHKSAYVRMVMCSSLPKNWNKLNWSRSLYLLIFKGNIWRYKYEQIKQSLSKKSDLSKLDLRKGPFK